MIGRLLGRWAWRVSPRWAFTEAIGLVLLSCVVLLLLLGMRINLTLLQLQLLIVNPAAILWCALRLREMRVPWFRKLVDDVVVAVPLVLGLGTLQALTTLTRLYVADITAYHVGFATFILIAYGVLFVGTRVFVRFVRWWDHLRRTRFAWSLTNALLFTFVFAIIAGAFLIFANGIISTGRLDDAITPGGALGAFGLLLIGPIPTFVALMLFVGTICFFGALPAALLFSYLFVQRTTRRIEHLDTAASNLRAGDYGARVRVSGEDEIARLQTTFNAMATDLQHGIDELAAERDTVSGLLESRRQLIANVSHELRTPVATLRGYLESAQTRWLDAPPEIRDDIAVMERETVRLQRLIDELFTLSRAEVGSLTLRSAAVDAGEAVRASVKALAPLAWRSGRVEVVADLAADLPLVSIDASRWEQVILNLLHNAIRHTPPGGIVAVLAHAEEDTVVFEVRDTGSGIAPDDLPHIWERFYRAGASGGTGLGLALVKELTEAMGGSVSVTSTVGEGSSFVVRLVRADRNKLSEPIVSESAAPRTLPQDDQPSRRHWLPTLSERLGRPAERERVRAAKQPTDR